MDKFLTKEEFEKIVEENRNSFYCIAAGGGMLRHTKIGAFFATSIQAAKDYFDSIKDELPEDMKKFSVIKVDNVVDIYSFSPFFYLDNKVFLTIYIVDYGFVVINTLVRKNPENIELFKLKFENLKLNDVIYSIFEKNGLAYNEDPEYRIRQIFYSNLEDAEKYIKEHNTEELGLFAGWIELDMIQRGAINDLLECKFDGVNCTGWDITEASAYQCKECFYNSEQIREYIGNSKLYILATSNDLKYVVRHNGYALFFTSEEKAREYIDKNKNKLLDKYDIFPIERNEFLNALVRNSSHIYINYEIECYRHEFLLATDTQVGTGKYKTMLDVILKAREIWNKDELYIILSLNNADRAANVSIPYVVDSSPRCLWIFDDVSKAKGFIDRNQKGKINDFYPIGIIKKSDFRNNLYSTLLVSSALDIPDIDFNPEEEDSIHFNIKELCDINNTALKYDFAYLMDMQTELKFNYFELYFK